jgi:hypothetical protein
MTDRDAQPANPYPSAGGARPIPPTRQVIPLAPLEDPLPSEDERKIGKEAIAEIREELKEMAG